MEPEMSVRPRPCLPQLPIPSQTGNNPNCSSISINTRISSDIEVHSMLLKITLLIFKLSSDLSIGGGSSTPPDAVFIILQIIKNKANLQANHHPARHHAGNCINRISLAYNTRNKNVALTTEA
jgi:hypothetical protein